MSSSLIPPLRSAMKHPSRPGTPTSGCSSNSPQITRVPLPSPSPTPVASQSPPKLTSFSRTQSSNSLPALSATTPPTGLLSQSHSYHGASTAPHYTPKVSFDTFENPVASMFSFTLQVKSEGYLRTRNTRVFLCASSPDESGREALEWSLEYLVQDGDELIVFRGADEDVFQKDHNIVREEARELMRAMQQRSTEYDPDRKLSLILEYIPGKITDTIDRLIALYRPDSLVVGTRGRRFGAGLVQGLGLGVGSGAGIGSVSKYCLSHSPVPVIVVRPGRKLRKAVEKRRADPKRGTHFE
ncbi:hypothetical protein M413DRAFT_449259 [Hebeloma cylindrosporum]|uniref:UspA domain-containing protein n=1 Tax=Hebeloma cylindrosporum TaxID=76867 RepID=A0A0C2XEN1_HEBCY|nr:hypothetical protein M413DRAFT_449259 [Hebeloma cylindrosporum h7]